MDVNFISEGFLHQLVKDVGLETMPVLMKTFEKGAREHIRALKTAAPNTDDGLEKIRFHGHALKGMAQSLGLPALSALGAHLEMRSKKLQNNPATMDLQFWPRATEIIAVLEALLRESLRALQDWLSALNNR